MILHDLKSITDVIVFDSLKDWFSEKENIKYHIYQIYINKDNKIDLFFSLLNSKRKYNLTKIDVRDFYSVLNNFVFHNILDEPILFLENYGNYSFYEKQKIKRIRFFGDSPITVAITNNNIFLVIVNSQNLFMINLGTIPFNYNHFIKNINTKRPFNIIWNKEGFKIVFSDKQKKKYSSLQVNF